MRAGVVLLVLVGSFAHSKERVDLSTGIVSPSNNESVFLNPAALGSGGEKVFDVALRLQDGGSPGYQAGYSHGGNRVGAGFLLVNQNSQSDGVGALGFKVGKFELGVAGFFDLEDFSSDFNAGVRVGGGKGLTLGFVVYDVTDFDYRVAIGFGFLQKKELSWEIDITFDYDPNGSTFDEVSITAGVRVSAGKKLSLKAGTAFRVLPDFGFFSNSLQAGLAYWLGSKFAAYGVMNASFLSPFPSAETQAGVKLIF